MSPDVPEVPRDDESLERRSCSHHSAEFGRYEPGGMSAGSPEDYRKVVAQAVSGRQQRLTEQLRAIGPAPAVKPVTTLSRYRNATPCGSVWEEMSGSGRFRVCGACQLHVYNVADVGVDDVKELVFQRENKERPVFFRRADGRFLTADCPVGRRRRRNLVFTSLLTVAVLVGCTLVALNLRSPAPETGAAPVITTGWDIDSAEIATRGSSSADGQSTTPPDADTDADSDSVEAGWGRPAPPPRSPVESVFGQQPQSDNIFRQPAAPVPAFEAPKNANPPPPPHDSGWQSDGG